MTSPGPQSSGPPAVPDDPADRRVERRRAVRVLLIDPDGATLLFLDSDLGLDPVPHWWVTPGGGVDPGESDQQAAVREVAEETGWRCVEADLIGPLARRHVRHGYSDKIVLQDEVYYAVRVPRFEVSDAGYTQEERLTIAEVRWWPRPELETTSDDLWPRELLRICQQADEWPCPTVELADSDESTVPVGIA